MSDFRTRARLLLVKNEAVSGTEETPTPAANAVRVENLQVTPNFDVIDTNEVNASLDDDGPIVGGGNMGLTAEVLLKGAGTAGAAPEYGTLLRGSALSETITASAVTGAAAGGAAASITLAAAASAVDNAYRGMVIRLTAGPGSGESNVITAYDGTSKVATVAAAWVVEPVATTTSYSIDANVLYRPVSTGLETLTAYAYENNVDAAANSRLTKLIAAAGSFQATVPTRGVARLSFSLTGILPAAPANVTAPAAPTYDAVRPEPFINAQALLGGVAVKFSTCSLDFGAEVAQADDPAAAYGYDKAQQVGRRISGTIDPALTLLSTRNVFADFLAGTERTLVLRWGSVAGNRISILCPSVQFAGATPGDVNGFINEQVPFRANGADSGIFICVH